MHVRRTQSLFSPRFQRELRSLAVKRSASGTASLSRAIFTVSYSSCIPNIIVLPQGGKRLQPVASASREVGGQRLNRSSWGVGQSKGSDTVALPRGLVGSWLHAVPMFVFPREDFSRLRPRSRVSVAYNHQ